METTLYAPIKDFLETAGYVVKGEIGGCDVVGVSEGEPDVVVVCELKLSFNLELILQAAPSPTRSGLPPASRPGARGARVTVAFVISAAGSESACCRSPMAARST